MRFQAIERVPVEDSGRVLAVLEQRLRAMVTGVEREGNRITLSGLGPSSRAVNRHDMTVIDVWDDNGVTIIGADVTFQASALLGATGQEEIMRLKLERLFEETKEQLDLENRRDESRIARMEALVAGESAPISIHPPDVSEREDLSTSSSKAQPLPIDGPLADGHARDTTQEDAAAAEPAPSAESPAAAAEHTSIVPPGHSMVASETLVYSEDADLLDNDERPTEDAEGKSSRWILWALLAACIPAVLPFAIHTISTLRADKPPAATLPVSPPRPAVNTPARPVPAAEPADLLRQWELAMRSRDAAAQASFYAVPVERYFLRHNVSKQQVEADKQQHIDNRKGLWTVKMEKVKISRTSDNTATVRLVKHYIQQEDGKPISEWFVPSQLKLKSEFGVWWITSERDLSWTTSPDEV